MNDIITAVANVAIALTFVAGLVFGIAQVRAAARDRRERLTLETLHNFQTREFSALMYYVIARDMPSSRDGLRALPADDQIKIIQFGQQMETLGMLVAEELIDMALVDKTLGSFVATSWDKYKTMYLDMREKLPDPFLGEYFQWLAERIKERMEANPRKPFYKAATGRGAGRGHR
ncbi:MAG TPA: hypothetical protein VIY51_23335 [Xanthobacteraceae bacterium]